MTKEELRAALEQGYEDYRRYTPVHTYAYCDAKTEAVKKSLENRKAPVNLRQENWDKYLKQVEEGTYTPPENADQDIHRRQRAVKRLVSSAAQQSNVVWSTDKFFK